MKRILATMVLVLAGVTSRADTVTTNWSSGFTASGVIPDGNLAGWSDTRVIGGLSGLISDVNLSLTLSGGNNGDLYAYLVHSSGFAVLLNRVGRDGSNPFGYGNAGINVTFNDGAATDIHYYGGTGIPSGSFQPDARNISPLSSGATLAGFDRANSGAWLSSFTNQSANGSWTLFIADVVGGGTGPTVTSWGLSLDLVPVPEASQWAMCGAMAVFGAGYFWRVRKQVTGEKSARK
ncbi:MAG: PEP-CTERM sorting domain-containing protein [Verrucomicrobia bacterium]|nr:MAG: PEP-CTERM sorting domain-containing protein [Verrucomicrobiota bacterium]